MGKTKMMRRRRRRKERRETRGRRRSGGPVSVASGPFSSNWMASSAETSMELDSMMVSECSPMFSNWNPASREYQASSSSFGNIMSYFQELCFLFQATI
eukprot:4619126-Pyramimonas_sp.AAC.1